MSSNMRQLLTGGAALILALVLWTGTSLAHDAQRASVDAGGRSAIIAGTPATPARIGAGMPMTGTLTCPGHGKMCGGMTGHSMNGHSMTGHGTMDHGMNGHGTMDHGMTGHGMMDHGMTGRGMMGRGAMGHGMTGRGMMRGQMMQHGGAANGAGAAAANPAASDAAGTGAAGTGAAGTGAAGAGAAGTGAAGAGAATLPESFATALAEADARRGQQLTRTFGCIGCHSLDASLPMAGPTWHELAQTAGARVPGQDATAYLYTSIVRPNAFVVPGYLPNIMVQNYGQQLDEQELADIVKHLLTLEE